MQAIERHVEPVDWITIILMGALVLLALTRTLYPQRFADFATQLTSNKFMMFKGKENTAFHPFNILIFLVNIISVSLFLFFLYEYFFEENPNSAVRTYIRIATAYTSFVLLKFGIEKIIANVFGIDEKINKYLFQKLSHRNFLSLFLLVFCFFIVYTVNLTPLLLYIVIGGVLCVNLLSLFVIYRKNQNLIAGQWFYFILYLCALEIAPYIILYKLFTI